MRPHQKRVLLLEDETRLAIGAYFDVYNELAGYPEFVLRRALAIAMEDVGLKVRQEVALPVWFRGRRIATFRADLIVDPGLIVEVKTAAEIEPFHKAQLLHYLKATNLEVGLLLNFGRRPEFSRVVYENIRKRPRVEPPTNLDEVLENGDYRPKPDS
jgi:GxxExxY protein